MKTTHLLSLAALALVSMTGCRHRGPEYAHNKWCDQNPQSVEVYLDQTPERPYKVVGVVDGSFAVGAGRQMRKMQIRACRLGADAVLDHEQEQEPEIVRERTVVSPYGIVTEHRVRRGGPRYGSMLAIKFTDGEPAATPAAPPMPIPMTPPEQPEQPEQPEAPPQEDWFGRKIQIQTSGGIEIHAPSVEFRNAPPAAPARPAAPPQPPAAEEQGDE